MSLFRFLQETLRAQRLKTSSVPVRESNYQARMNFSSENVIAKRVTQQGSFCGGILKVEIVVSKRLVAQQRYFSYRAILVAIVSQNNLVLVFMGYRTMIARYVAKWGVAQMCLCETKCQGGVSHHFGGVLTSLKKYRAIWGIAAIVSAMSRDMGPLSPSEIGVFKRE